MEIENTQIPYKAKWTRRLALALSLLYLTNPLHVPISIISHHLINAFESTDQIIEHKTGFVGNTLLLNGGHNHETMRLESGHSLIDFILQAFDTTNSDESNQSPQKTVKIDKHIKTDKYPEGKIYPIEKKCNFFLGEYGLITTYSAVLKEPPKFILL